MIVSIPSFSGIIRSVTTTSGCSCAEQLEPDRLSLGLAHLVAGPLQDLLHRATHGAVIINGADKAHHFSPDTPSC